MKNFFIRIVCLVLVTGNSAVADDLEEAQGLPDEIAPMQQPFSTAIDQGSVCNHHGHARLSYSVVKAPGEAGEIERSFPNLSASITADCQATKQLQLFTDFRGEYANKTSKHLSVFEQGGLRFRPSDELVVVLGKERNRRAPGLIVSPSDFIHTSENLPGLDEQRAGEWLIRSSWQTRAQTADVILLPASKVSSNGFPARSAKTRGVAVRYLKQFSNFDLNLAAGYLDEAFRAGISTQGFIISSWRVYAEAGYDHEKDFLLYTRKQVASYLAGSGYDGNKFTSRIEYYRNGAGLSSEETKNLRSMSRRPSSSAQTATLPATMTPFLRQQYVIANFSLIEIFDHFNLSESLIQSLDDPSWIMLSRVEWLLGARSVIGLTVKNLDRTDKSQYFARTTDWEAGADWKLSF